MSMFWLYIVMRLDSLKEAIGSFSVVSSIVVFIVSAVCWVLYLEKDIEKRLFPIVTTIMLIAMLLLGLFSVLLPTTKEVAVLYVAPKVANSKFINEDLPEEAKELYDLAKKYLKEKVKEK